eukprot:797552-Amphidinium_carterae.1
MKVALLYVLSMPERCHNSNVLLLASHQRMLGRTLADKVEESFGCCAHMKAELAEVKQGSAEVEVRLAKGLKAGIAWSA